MTLYCLDSAGLLDVILGATVRDVRTLSSSGEK